MRLICGNASALCRPLGVLAAVYPLRRERRAGRGGLCHRREGQPGHEQGELLMVAAQRMMAQSESCPQAPSPSRLVLQMSPLHDRILVKPIEEENVSGCVHGCMQARQGGGLGLSMLPMHLRR
jgi:hypothetical protein